MKKIVVIGSSNVDTTLHVENFPKPGETINAQKVSEAGGGKGANQAVAAAKSGAETVFISRVGQDSYGSWMKEQLAGYGVKTDYVLATEGVKTGHAYITLNAEGQNDIIIDHGANYSLTEADVLAAKDVIEASDCVIAQLETPLAATTAAFKLAKAAGKVTILNPAPAIKDLPADLLAVTDLITPNETESALLTSLPVAKEADLEKNAAKLHELGVKHVIITYGSKGAYLSSPVFTGLVPAFKVKAVDTTAAGDTFLGFLAGELASDFSNLHEAARFANRASSLAVQKMGAQPSIPDRASVAAALAE
ncbi:ribokinase [Lactobacillus nasalidis]|uniref:Ribokinase n=1 Tax=Lactobacillus nasalidis TaxID=2797258 RepID=A0ABQ3W8K3_9LACO|nr:ribokinase [Lactobacillus nasalidis]GHV97418.1 ribokinase [Lactobacillus nasalidis]GHV99848.1 ribokinase [Lactobacillus nasalidis]GHW00517.1 ribokinase [Lactobacillus nasalidis]